MIKELILASLAVAVRGTPIGGRIVGGEQASIKELPYQVSVQYRGGHWCVILNKRHILTAAHCTDRSPASLFTVRIGSSKYASDGQLINVAEIHQHPRYKSTDYDVTILVLEEDIVFNKGAQPIVLATNDPPSKSTAQFLAGVIWKKTFPFCLIQKIIIPSISREECRYILGSNVISEQMICAGDINGERDTCQGHSGGPLVCDRIQVGVVSWRYGCAQPNNPGVYASVAALCEFIDENSKI